MRRGILYINTHKIEICVPEYLFNHKTVTPTSQLAPLAPLSTLGPSLGWAQVGNSMLSLFYLNYPELAVHSTSGPAFSFSIAYKRFAHNPL